MIDIGFGFLLDLDFKKLTGRFSERGRREGSNQRRTQNYKSRQRRTRAELTDFNGMDFTECKTFLECFMQKIYVNQYYYTLNQLLLYGTIYIKHERDYTHVIDMLTVTVVKYPILLISLVIH